MAVAILLAMISGTGCATVSERVAAAGAQKANASLVGQALAAQAELPEFPEACRHRETAGLLRGDTPDDVISKYDHALGRANDKLASCVRWYDETRHGRALAAKRAR